jgi:hypothetical protein
MDVFGGVFSISWMYFRGGWGRGGWGGIFNFMDVFVDCDPSKQSLICVEGIQSI